MIGFSLERSVRTVVCFGSHADDIEIGAAATISRIAATNDDCTFLFVIATSDETRAAEAEASAFGLLGNRVAIEIAEFTDGLLPYEDPIEVKRFLRGACQGLTPDVVLCPSLDDRHQDHRFVAELTHQIMRDQLILQYEILKSDADLTRPGFYVPLTSDQALGKLEHLGEHFTSQQAKPWYNSETLQALMRLRGAECRAPDKFAEAFHVDRSVIRW